MRKTTKKKAAPKPKRRASKDSQEIRAKKKEINILKGMIRREQLQLRDAEKVGNAGLVLACKNAIKDLTARIELAEKRILNLKLAEAKERALLRGDLFLLTSAKSLRKSAFLCG